MKKNMFEDLCDEMEKIYKEQEGRVSFVRTIIREFIKKYDSKKDILIQLRAEAEGADISAFDSTIASCLAIFISMGSLLVTIFGKDDLKICLLALVVIGIMAIYLLYEFIRYKNVNKWKKYIVEVLNQMIEEIYI